MDDDMKCEFYHCIYNKDDRCRLKKIQINMLGMCDDCITVFLEHDFLEKKKMEQLEQMELRWLEDTEKR